MWWLSFRHGGAVILDVEATSVIHARMHAAMKGLGRVSDFEGGRFINAGHVALIPADRIGRMLSANEARQLRELLGYTRRED